MVQSDDRTADMMAAWNSGHSISQIAKSLGLSLGWTGTLLRRAGAELPETGRGIKRPLDEAAVVKQYKDGATVRALADRHGVSYGKIHRLLQAHRAPMRPRGFEQG